MENFGSMITASLLVIGTAGLLLNEFVLGWGTTATIAFALFNVAGIVILISSNWKNRRSDAN
ncbi:MAG: hypothetical protein ACWGO1_10240 [Anaerolineales bacterium]